MQAKFVKAGKYAHINEPAREQFEVTEEDVKSGGKVVSDMSESTYNAYMESGACEVLSKEEAEFAKELAVEEAEKSDDDNDDSGTDEKVEKGKGRKRGRSR